MDEFPSFFPFINGWLSEFPLTYAGKEGTKKSKVIERMESFVT